MNAHLERFFGSLKSECLDRLILFGENAMRNAVKQYLAHYHAERPHQGLDNELIVPMQPSPADCRRQHRIERTARRSASILSPSGVSLAFLNFSIHNTWLGRCCAQTRIVISFRPTWANLPNDLGRIFGFRLIAAPVFYRSKCSFEFFDPTGIAPRGAWERRGRDPGTGKRSL